MHQLTPDERMTLLVIELHDPITKLPISHFGREVLRTHKIETVEDFVALDRPALDDIAQASLYDSARIRACYQHLNGGKVFENLHG